jgi:hypothetical protein
MLMAMNDHPAVSVAVANERIWREERDGTWSDTGRTVWPPQDNITLFSYRLEDNCGRAKLCNSSMVWRTHGAAAWHTPVSIPIDVTEHFRERVVPHPLLLVHAPLVNYAETIETNRKKQGSDWGSYQCLLTGSVFAVLAPAKRADLADSLWARARGQDPVLRTILMSTGLAIDEARVLWSKARWAEKFRFCVTLVRRPLTMAEILRARVRKAHEWQFLLSGPFADYAKLKGR